MTRTMLASVALMGLVGCGRGKQEVAGADGNGRDLELEPSASGGTLSDRPASFTSTTRTLGEAEKVGVGTAIGAVAGWVIGGNATGAVVGGAVGAAGGTVVAIQTASRDVVVSTGAPVAITLTGPLTVSTK